MILTMVTSVQLTKICLKNFIFVFMYCPDDVSERERKAWMFFCVSFCSVNFLMFDEILLITFARLLQILTFSHTAIASAQFNVSKVAE